MEAQKPQEDPRIDDMIKEFEKFKINNLQTHEKNNQLLSQLISKLDTRTGPMGGYQWASTNYAEVVDTNTQYSQRPQGYRQPQGYADQPQGYDRGYNQTDRYSGRTFDHNQLRNGRYMPSVCFYCGTAGHTYNRCAGLNHDIYKGLVHVTEDNDLQMGRAGAQGRVLPRTLFENGKRVNKIGEVIKAFVRIHIDEPGGEVLKEFMKCNPDHRFQMNLLGSYTPKTPPPVNLENLSVRLESACSEPLINYAREDQVEYERTDQPDPDLVMLELRQRPLSIFALQAKRRRLSDGTAHPSGYEDPLAKDAAAGADSTEPESSDPAEPRDQATETPAATSASKPTPGVEEKTGKLLNEFLKQNMKVNVTDLIRLCPGFATALESYIANIRVEAEAVLHIDGTQPEHPKLKDGKKGTRTLALTTMTESSELAVPRSGFWNDGTTEIKDDKRKVLDTNLVGLSDHDDVNTCTTLTGAPATRIHALPMMYVRVGPSEESAAIRAILDTGSEANIVSAEYADRHGLAYEPTEVYSSAYHTGRPIRFLGEMRERIWVAGQWVPGHFFVMPLGQTKHDILLGMPFAKDVSLTFEWSKTSDLLRANFLIRNLRIIATVYAPKTSVVDSKN